MPTIRDLAEDAWIGTGGGAKFLDAVLADSEAARPGFAASIIQRLGLTGLKLLVLSDSPTAAQIPYGTVAIVENTSTGRTSLWGNVDGAIVDLIAQGNVASVADKKPTHPLDGTVYPVIDDSMTHPWVGPAGELDSVPVLVRFTNYGSWRHTVSPSSSILMEVIRGGGLPDPAETLTVFSVAGQQPRGLVGGKVGANNVGVMYLVVDSLGNSVSLKWSYTTSGTSVTTSNVSGGLFYPHGDPLVLSNGNVVIIGMSGNDIWKAVSVDGGLTFSASLLKAAPSEVQTVEPVMFAPADGKYLVFARADAGSNNVWAFTTSNFSTTTAWVDTGIPNGPNPLAALDAWGASWLYQSARRGSPIGGFENKLLVRQFDGVSTYNAGGVFSSPPPVKAVLDGKNVLIGYLTIAKVRDGTYTGHLIDGESNNGQDNASASRIVRISAGANSSSPIGRIGELLTPAGDFQSWPNGTSFSGTGALPVMPGFTVIANGASATVSRVTVTNDMAQVLTHRPAYAMRVQSSSTGYGRSFKWTWSGKDAVFPLLGRVISAVSEVSGSIPGYLQWQINVNYGSGGDASMQVVRNTSQQNVSSTGVTTVGATMTTPALPSSWGTNPYMEVALFTNDFGFLDATFYSLFVRLGDNTARLTPKTTVPA